MYSVTAVDWLDHDADWMKNRVMSRIQTAAQKFPEGHGRGTRSAGGRASVGGIAVRSIGKRRAFHAEDDD